MDSLPADLLPELLAALGDTAVSYASGVMLTGASTTFHALGARLPRINDVCALNVYQVAHVIALTKSNAWDVFDVDLRRICTVCCDARLCKFTFPNKPAVVPVLGGRRAADLGDVGCSPFDQRTSRSGWRLCR